MPLHFDGRGCLSPEGLTTLRNAPIGAAPPDLAGHLASCPRCQERMLAAEAAMRASSAPSARRPHPSRTLYLLLAVLVAGAALLVSTYWILRDRLIP
jgi:hypothetical protein